MFWIICLIVSVLLIACAAVVLFTKRYGKLRYVLPCVLLAGAAVVLYCPHFFNQYNTLSGVLSSLLNIMQIISLDADFFGMCTVVREQLNPAILEDAYIFTLALIHIALPLVAVLTAYSIIAYYMAQAKLLAVNLTNCDVFVFSAYTKKAALLARDINKKHGKKACFVFAGKLKTDDIDSSLSDDLNCIFYDEDAAKVNIKLKKKRKIYYFNMAENEDENLNNSLALIERYADSDLQSNVSIMAFLKSDEPDILFDASRKGNINIRIIDEDQTAVYELLNRKPLYTAAKDNLISLLIVGFDNVAEELLKAAVWCGQLENIALKVNVITNRAEQKKARLLFKYPEILSEEYNIAFHESALNEVSLSGVLEQYCADATYIVVANGSDERNLGLAVYLRRFFLSSDPGFANMPFIAARIKSIEKYESIKRMATPEFNELKKMEYAIYPYGSDSDIYSYSELVDAPLEKLAMNVHLTYEDIFSDGNEIDVGNALARYNVFEVKKRSSRTNAMHIKYKLWLMGLDYVETGDIDVVDDVDFSKHLSDEYLHRLAIMEHDRWMAFLRTEGWAAASIDKTAKYQGISKGRHECPIIKLHPYICPFDDLEACSKALNLPDATIYDIELIKRIPGILHDKWNAAEKRYKIVKQAKEES